jgi:hypothetical protein
MNQSKITTRVVRTSDHDLGLTRLQPQALCPGCGFWMDCNERNILGKEAVICPTCGWYGFRILSSVAHSNS